MSNRDTSATDIEPHTDTTGRTAGDIRDCHRPGGEQHKPWDHASITSGSPVTGQPEMYGAAADISPSGRSSMSSTSGTNRDADTMNAIATNTAPTSSPEQRVAHVHIEASPGVDTAVPTTSSDHDSDSAIRDLKVAHVHVEPGDDI